LSQLISISDTSVGVFNVQFRLELTNVS